MKINEIIVEQRRNRDNPAQQKEFLEKYLASLPSLEGIYVHYTDIEKIGINPKSDWHETPRGIYAYSPSYDDEGEVHAKWKPKHQENTKYVYVLQTKPNTRLLNFKDYTLKQFKEDFEKLGGEWEDKYSEYDSENLSRVIYSQTMYSKQNTRSTTASAKRSEIFYRVLGYDGLEDPGFGIIHKNERSQTVFFHTGAFKVLKLLKDYKSSTKYKNFDYTMNPTQIEKNIEQGQWQVLRRIKPGDTIDITPESQLKLLDVNIPGVKKAQIDIAIKAVARPTEMFYKAAIDKGYADSIPDTAPDNVKLYKIAKDPTSILSMKTLPSKTLELLNKKLSKDVALKLINARKNILNIK